MQLELAISGVWSEVWRFVERGRSGVKGSKELGRAGGIVLGLVVWGVRV